MNRKKILLGIGTFIFTFLSNVGLLILLLVIGFEVMRDEMMPPIFILSQAVCNLVAGILLIITNRNQSGYRKSIVKGIYIATFVSSFLLLLFGLLVLYLANFSLGPI